MNKSRRGTKKHKSKLIRSTYGKEKIIAVVLTDGTKIRIVRDEGVGAWLEIEPVPQISTDTE
jgi:hypothetical protein